MGAVLADMTKDAGEVFARLLAVSETVVTGDDVIAVRRLVDTAELVCTRMVGTFAGETSMRRCSHGLLWR